MTNLAFLLNLDFFSVLTYRLMMTPKMKHQSMHAVEGNKKYSMAEVTMMLTANMLLTYYFKASLALRTNRAPPAALHPSTVSLIYTFTEL